MGKSGKDRKRQRLLREKVLLTTTDDLDDSDSDVGTDSLSEKNISDITAVFDALAQNLHIFSSPDMKAFRIALGPLVDEQRNKHFERRKQTVLVDKQLADLLDKASIASTIRHINHLSSNLEVFRSKELKSLRASLHPLVLEMIGQNKKNGNASTNKSNMQHESTTTMSSTTVGGLGGYTGRISAHFIAEEWEQALCELEAMRVAGQSPKLGALQRWVRDADFAPAELRFPLIDAVLRVVALLADRITTIAGKKHSRDDHTTSDGEGARDLKSVVNRATAPIHMPLFDLDFVAGTTEPTHKSSSEVVEQVVTPQNIRIVSTVSASDRPSKTDLFMYALTPPGVFALSNNTNDETNNSYSSERKVVQVPGVPGGFVMLNALTLNECDECLRIANLMSFRPDAVAGKCCGATVRYLSNIFHFLFAGINHVLWLADDALTNSLYDRVKSMLPQSMDGCALAGLNARLRLFRYEPGKYDTCCWCLCVMTVVVIPLQCSQVPFIASTSTVHGQVLGMTH